MNKNQSEKTDNKPANGHLDCIMAMACDRLRDSLMNEQIDYDAEWRRMAQTSSIKRRLTK
jgi:hypothetical protein